MDRLSDTYMDRICISNKNFSLFNILLTIRRQRAAILVKPVKIIYFGMDQSNALDHRISRWSREEVHRVHKTSCVYNIFINTVYSYEYLLHAHPISCNILQSLIPQSVRSLQHHRNFIMMIPISKARFTLERIVPYLTLYVPGRYVLACFPSYRVLIYILA